MSRTFLSPRPAAASLAVLLLCLLLSGCQRLTQAAPQTTAPAPAVPAVAAEPTHSRSAEGDSARLQQCQGQLDALKVMNPEQYKRQRSAFDSLMHGAAQYAGLRNKTNAETRDTVDALYRYRASLLCAQIAQTLLDSLTSRGEARP